MKSKSTNIIITIIAVVAILAAGIIPMLTKNSAEMSGDATIADEKSGNAQNSGALTLYVIQINGDDDPVLKPLIDTYQKQYPNIKLNKVYFGGTDQDFGKYYQRLLDDTLAGNGPDVLMINTQSQDAYRLEKSGVLENLLPYLSNDKLYNKANLNMNVIDSGKLNGKQLLLPVDYYVSNFNTSSELLSKYNIKLPKNNKLNDFMKVLKPYLSSADGKNKKLFAFPITISDFLAATGADIIDYDSKKTSFDTAEFKTIMEDYKQIYKATPKPSDFEYTMQMEGQEAFQKGNTLFSTHDDININPHGILDSESILKGTLGMTQVISNFPTYEGGNQVIATSDYCLAMSGASKNKQAAYQFIRNALTQQYQVAMTDRLGFPILTSASTEVKNNYSKKFVGKTELQDHKEVTYQEPSNNLGSFYENASKNVNKCMLNNSSMEQILEDSMKAYLEDRESFDSALKSLENKVNLYLNE